VLAPATLAALPSTRAIETRLLPSSLAAIHRGFAFYVAFPKTLHSLTRDVFYVARRARSIAKFTEPEKTFLCMDLSRWTRTQNQ
jgi:hypothetical protein